MQRYVFIAATIALVASLLSAGEPNTETRSVELQNRVMEALSPEQLEQFLEGEDASSILLEDGTSLASLIAAASMATSTDGAYHPLPNCQVVATNVMGGAFSAGETRPYLVRGPTADLSAQGGSPTGCGVPLDASAVVMNLTVWGYRGSGQVQVFATGSLPGPSVIFRDALHGPYANMLTVAMGGSSGDFSVRLAGQGQVKMHVVGYFSPLPTGAGSNLDADTLDGLDSTDFAGSAHSHDGADISSGTVFEPRIDAAISRDVEVLPIVLAGDGSGSTLDADLLDGRDSLDLMLQVGNCLTVSASCPAGAADALAARCWQAIQAALDAINGTDLPLATATNRYLIKVGPGKYAERVTMKQFVDIEGAGEKLTIIEAAGGATRGAGATVRGADNAELRFLRVNNTAGGAENIAIYNSNASPMLKHVTAYATGSTAAILNDGGASSTLTHVTAESGGAGVLNEDASVTIRDSVVNGIQNTTAGGFGSSASVVNSQLIKPAAGVAATFRCLGAYDGSFSELDANCQP